MKRSPKLPRIASIVAFAMAGLTVVAGIAGPVVVLPMALVPLFAGIGIVRRRVWSAYGFAVYLFASVLLLPVVVYGSNGPATSTTGSIAAAVVSTLIAILFVFAGRALANEGAMRGGAWPWVIVSVLSTLPLILLEPFVMPTGSMENTILVGDRILVQRFPRRTAQRGDIFAMVYPVNRKEVFVKRVVGLPGDRIRISGKIVYRNGNRLNEPYVVHKSEYEDAYRDNFPSEPNTPVLPPAREMFLKNVVNGEVIVPAGKLFVLGDNRDLSLDSRYWGFVEDRDLIGRPLMIYDSADQTTDQSFDRQWFHHHTRWNRLFRLL